MSERKNVYIIDGHNVLRKVGPQLGINGGDHFDQRFGLAEVMLEFQSRTGDEVRLVFDGSGPDRPIRDMPAGISVEYARGPGGADRVIESMVRKLGGESGTGLVHVVTDDKGIRDTVSGRTVRVLATSALVELLRDERATWSDGSASDPSQGRRAPLGSLLPEDVRLKLERLRRGE